MPPPRRLLPVADPLGALGEQLCQVQAPKARSPTARRVRVLAQEQVQARESHNSKLGHGSAGQPRLPRLPRLLDRPQARWAGGRSRRRCRTLLRIGRHPVLRREKRVTAHASSPATEADRARAVDYFPARPLWGRTCNAPQQNTSSSQLGLGYSPQCAWVTPVWKTPRSFQQQAGARWTQFGPEARRSRVAGRLRQNPPPQRLCFVVQRA